MVDQRRTDEPFKPLDQVLISANHGCRLCKFLAARHDGPEGCDPRLAIDLNVERNNDEYQGFIRFMRPQDGRQVKFGENGYIAGQLHFQTLTGALEILDARSS